MSEHNIQNPFWVYARAPSDVAATMPLGLNVGKWCIFVHCDELEEVWANVKRATKVGLLWRGSKVSTQYANARYLMRNPSANPNEHVICVFTYDYRDEDDVMRVRQALYKIGIGQALGYKTDADTAAGIERWTFADTGWTR
jgi:hypothetical protein